MNTIANKKWDWEKDHNSSSSASPRFDSSIVPHKTGFLLFGGMAEGWQIQNDLHSFDFGTGKWSSIEVSGNKPQPVKDHSASVDNKYMYIFGGKTVGKHSLNDLWQFNMDNQTWTKLSVDSGYLDDSNTKYPCKRYGHSSIYYKSNLYIFGGKRHSKDTDALNDFWQYNIANNTWKKIACKNSPQGILYHSATCYNNQMVVYGGYRNNKPVSEMWILNLDSYEWTYFGESPLSPRSGHFADIKGDVLYVFGGEGWKDNLFTSENDLWAYHLKNKKWEQLANSKLTPEGRLGVRGMALNNNKIDSLKDVEIVIGFGINVDGKWNPQHWFNDLWYLRSSP